MAGFAPEDADSNVRRRRLVFRAWHRGTREMDIIFGKYADAHAFTMSDEDLDTLEALMEAPDTEVFGWITGQKVTPANFDTPLLHRIRAFHHDLPGLSRGAPHV